ncbi:calcium-binding protein [Enterovibrio sp. 27052020O]|uniref:calcium-binding protein n=1 Tax=Enterovibrio sp. 27052020O TaxID=3241166 RepID=UPI003890BEB8
MATITGGNTSDNLVGTTDDDILYGLLGEDTLRGYAGNDTAYGDSSASEIQDLTPNADGSYSLQSDTFVSVSLTQFNFALTDEKSLGYAILDASGNVISKSVIVDYANLAERGSAIDINTAGGVTLVFFTFPSSQLSGFEWRPLDLNAVDTNISTADVTIQVKEINSDASTHGDDALYGYEGDDQLFGEGGNDSIVGGDGHDIISCGDGDDSAWGNNGDDHLHGGIGNDKLYGQNGKDKLEGGAGDDELWGGRDDDTLLAGSGDDYVEGQDGNDTIQAGEGDDEVWGGSGNDNIRGDQGNDYIDAESGDDLVYGGAGNDEIYGNDGHDDLRGNAGNDILYGQHGNDILRGGAGNDYLDGGDGDDEIYGNLGTNTLLGGEGNDYLFAGWFSADNYLDGQAGQDTLIGSIGSDTLIFDENDFQGQIKTLANGNQINKHMYDASSGFDTLVITGAQHADFTGASYQADPSIEGNVIAGIEAVIGDSANQTVTISAHEIDAQSDTTSGDDWQGFVAWLGNGDDTLNLTGADWQYDAAATSNADITPTMIAKMGLSAAQVADLQAYVFNDIYSNDQITIWTDADSITYLGTDIV